MNLKKFKWTRKPESYKIYDDRIEIKEKAIYVVPNLQDMNNMTSNIYKANKLELISENTNVDNGSEEEYKKYFEKIKKQIDLPVG